MVTERFAPLYSQLFLFRSNEHRLGFNVDKTAAWGSSVELLNMHFNNGPKILTINTYQVNNIKDKRISRILKDTSIVSAERVQTYFCIYWLSQGSQ